MKESKQHSNLIWRLDLLEYKYCGANPRLPTTKKLLEARNNAKILKKIEMPKENALEEITSIKRELFKNKYYSGYQKLLKEVRRSPVLESKNDSDTTLHDFFNDSKKVGFLVTSKLIKLINSNILNENSNKSSIPAYLPQEVVDSIVDKKNECNPSNFFMTYCQNNSAVNKFVSELWNRKPVKKILEEISWSFKNIRGNTTKEERNRRIQLKSKNAEREKSKKNTSTNSESLSSHLFSNADDISRMISDDYSDESEDDFLQNQVEVKHNLKPKVQLTPSTQSDQDVHGHNLPELASGYYSGGSDEEEFDLDDDVVEQVTKSKKNRRGQRARQKIWEQKYGKSAKHVQKRITEEEDDRHRRKLEYEDRCRKRALKAADQSSYEKRLNPKTEQQSNLDLGSKELHPSWVAKKEAEEKAKNLKFSGKKIKFN